MSWRASSAYGSALAGASVPGDIEVPVLIVGAGPGGLAAAIALARAGVRCLLAERRDRPPRMPRATTVSLRSMEIIRGWGLEQEVRAGGVDVDWLLWATHTLAEAERGVGIRIGLPTREQSALISPTSPASIPQDHMEPVLLDHLRSLAPARVELGVEVTDVTLLDHGVEATLRRPGGPPRRVHARYLIAADGAHGGIRDRLGIARNGRRPLQDAVSALFRAPLWDLVGDRRYGLYATQHPGAPGIFLPAGPGDRWVYGLLVGPDGPPAEQIDQAMLARQIRTGAGAEGIEPRIERTGRFTLVAGLAESFRRGNAFLVGDAAHRVTPRGGTGMNMALQGGFDLGWKLSWVLRGWSDAGLLDSYERERMPIARHNIQRSIDPDGSQADPATELQVDLAGRIPHMWTSGAEGPASVLDLLGQRLTLFTSRPADWVAPAAAVTGMPPVDIRHVDDVAARGLGVRGGAALLLRPDGVPAGWLPAGGDRTAALRAALGGGRREPVPPVAVQA